MAKINIFNDRWCDILFEDRNQSYGAFTLRKESGSRHLLAILVTVSLFTLGVMLPTIIKKVMPKEKVTHVEVTELASLKPEQNKKNNDESKKIEVQEYKPVKATVAFVPPVIKPDEEVSNTDTIKTVEELNNARGAIYTETHAGVIDDATAVNPDVEQIIEDTATKVYSFVEQMPEFPGGEEQLRKYLASNIRYPEIAQENGIQGRVFVSFVVGKDGYITDIQVVRGVDPSLDREAIRVIKAMPPWKSGKQNGAAVRVSMSLPVNFKLE
jgi:periplasmic protein TonB